MSDIKQIINKYEMRPVKVSEASGVTVRYNNSFKTDIEYSSIIGLSIYTTRTQ